MPPREFIICREHTHVIELVLRVLVQTKQLRRKATTDTGKCIYAPQSAQYGPCSAEGWHMTRVDR